MRTESKENLVDAEVESGRSAPAGASDKGDSPDAANVIEDYVLTQVEKKFLLCADRGDCAGVRR